MSTPGNILVVDDEEQIIRVLESSLEAEGYAVTVARNAQQALDSIAHVRIDAMILDLGLPDRDGKEVIAESRNIRNLPIIVLSARGSENEKIEALDLGAIDYVAKPFAIGELLARLRVALRRHVNAPVQPKFAAKGVEIDFASRRMVINKSVFRLSSRETKLLQVFVAARGEIVSHDDIIMAVWKDKSNADTQYVRVLVNQLRQKIEAEPDATRMLVTEPGLGYRLALPRGGQWPAPHGHTHNGMTRNGVRSQA
ncbi:MAG: response regulator transcription factor [Alphaproteobacteria bacterium]|nr:response regulator transcription factor [Alphaproteobacteria bacterium]